MCCRSELMSGLLFDNRVVRAEPRDGQILVMQSRWSMQLDTLAALLDMRRNARDQRITSTFHVSLCSTVALVVISTKQTERSIDLDS
jgi:hypothetical protein